MTVPSRSPRKLCGIARPKWAPNPQKSLPSSSSLYFSDGKPRTITKPRPVASSCLKAFISLAIVAKGKSAVPISSSGLPLDRKRATHSSTSSMVSHGRGNIHSLAFDKSLPNQTDLPAGRTNASLVTLTSFAGASQRRREGDLGTPRRRSPVQPTSRSSLLRDPRIGPEAEPLHVAGDPFEMLRGGIHFAMLTQCEHG